MGCCEHHDSRVDRRDPTGTRSIVNRFDADLGRRFRSLKGLIVESLVSNDALGLKKSVGDSAIVRSVRDEALPSRAFAFSRSQDKVAGFMGWLRQQQDERVLGVFPGTPMERAAETAWTNTYIESSYQKGIRDAGSKLRAAGATVASSWVEQAFTRPIHADRLGLAFTRTFSELKGITEAMDQQISRILAQGLAEGQNPMVIARRINSEAFDRRAIVRSRVLARTEVIAAHAEATLNGFEEAGIEGVEVEAEFATAGDDRVCPECEALEGRVVPISEAHGIIPVHPNCLPGESMVLSRTGISAATKRHFDGEMIVIRTASGRELSCTPNHPVLTDCGWVPAERLNLASNVICDGGSEWVAGVDGDNDNVPSRIHDVAESFFRSSGVSAVPVPVSPEHFHGDGAGSKVAIVGANSLLGDYVGDTASGDALDYVPLKRGIMDAQSLISDGPLAQFFVRSLHAASSIMRRANLILSRMFVHPRPFHFFGLRPSPDWDSLHSEQGFDGFAIKPKAVSDGLAGLARDVSVSDFIGPHGGKLFARSVLASENSDDDFVRDAILARQLASGETIEVFADKVISVDRVAFSGHVYNLETGGGWYSANGIITHNCRCAWIPLVVNGTGIELI